MGREGLPLQHAVEVKGLEGLEAPVKRQGRTDGAKRGEVEGVTPLGEEVVVVGWRPVAALVKRGSGLSSSKYPSPWPPSKSERRRKGREGSEIAKRLRDKFKQERTTYLRALLLIICIKTDLH